MYNDYNTHDVAVYGGYLDNTDKLLQSTSGGIATALAEYFLSQGGYVVGVSYSNNFYKAEYSIIKDSADINKLKGSKYIDCDKTKIYAEVKALIETGKQVLFFGLPCTVAALYKFLKTKPDNLLTCELICHGPTYEKVHTDYIAYLERKFKGKVINFSVRHKADAWQPSYLYAKFDNGKIFQKPFFETEYGYAFSVLGKTSCYNCKFKGNNRQGDIMIGDFWGATEGDAYWNKYGVSSIFAETEKGNEFINATPGIKLFNTSFEKAVEYNPMVIMSRTKNCKRDELKDLLSKYDLITAVKRSKGLKIRIKDKLKKFIPNRIKSIIFKIVSMILKRI